MDENRELRDFDKIASELHQGLKKEIHNRCIYREQGRQEVLSLLHSFCEKSVLFSEDGKIKLETLFEFCERINDLYVAESLLSGELEFRYESEKKG